MPVDTSDHSRKGKKQINLSTFLQHPVNVLLLTFLPNFLTRIYLGILGTAYFIFASSERKKSKESTPKGRGFNCAPHRGAEF